MESKKSKNLPPVKALFIESWERLVRNAGNLVLFGIILWLIQLILIVVFGIGIWSSGLGSLVLGSGAEQFQNGDFSAIASFIPKILTWGVVGFILSIILGSVFRVMLISILGEEKKKEFSFSALFQKSLPLAFPLVLLSVLSFFLKTGSFFILFFPGLVVSFLFTFSVYELIYEQQKPIASLEKSTQIMLQNFGEVFVRFLAYVLFYLVVGIFIPNLIGKIDSTTGSILGLIVRLLINWYGMAYFVSLYKQVRKNTDFEKKASILWIWLVAVLGWLVVIGAFSFGIQVMNRANIWENINSEIRNEIDKESWEEFEEGGFEDFNQEELLEEVFSELSSPEDL